MTWEIVTGLILLVGFIVSVGTIVFRLAKILTKLETAVDNLRETITSIKDNNASEHTRIFEMIEKIDRRLTILETEYMITGEEKNPAR